MQRLFIAPVVALCLAQLTACAGAQAQAASTTAPELVTKAPRRSVADVHKAFVAHQSLIYTIYGLYLETPAAAEQRRGRIVVSLTITPTGDVADVHITSTTFDCRQLNFAVEEAIKTMQFGPADGAAFTVSSYPINFSPS